MLRVGGIATLSAPTATLQGHQVFPHQCASSEHSAGSEAFTGSMAEVETPECFGARALDANHQEEGLQRHIVGGNESIVALPDLLPPELLAHIFVFTQLVVSTPFRPFYASNVTWIWLSHVCQHWRAVALGCSALWSDITNVKQDLAEAMLIRSNQALLTVRYSHGGFYDYDVLLLTAIFPQLKRIRTLHLYNLRYDHIDYLTVCMPHLQELVLTSADSTARLPDAFLGGKSPPLARLHLEWFRIDNWKDLPIISRLVHLHLIPGNFPPLVVSGQELWTSLALMSALQSLTLHSILPRDGDMPCQQASSPIVFKCLRYLDLNDGITVITHFIRNLQIPQVTHLRIDTTREVDLDPPGASPSQLLESLRISCSIGGAPLQPWFCHSFDIATNRFLSLQAILFDVGFTAGAEHRFELTLTDVDITLSDYMLVFKEHMILETLRNLRIRPDEYDAPGPLLPTSLWTSFMPLPVLDQVEIQQSIVGFNAALSSVIPPDGFALPSGRTTALELPSPNWNGQPCFPALATLKCASVDFGGDMCATKGLAAVLRRLQAHRQGRTVRVEVDALSKHFGRGDLAHLRKEGIDVEWDEGPPPRRAVRCIPYEWLLQ